MKHKYSFQDLFCSNCWANKECPIKHSKDLLSICNYYIEGEL